ncbi:hypothetical protein L1987_87718 [Smallanthus sonchifolius]|nr:hypothetical protein L1987_87718 [Smallanthus sonchifolius]
MGTKTSINVVIRFVNRALALVMSVCASSILWSPFLASEALRSLHIGERCLDKGLSEVVIQLLGVSSLLLSQSAMCSNMELVVLVTGCLVTGVQGLPLVLTLLRDDSQGSEEGEYSLREFPGKHTDPSVDLDLYEMLS